METVLCKRPLTSSEGLGAFRFFFKHIICTENVTAVRYTLQRKATDVFSSHDCIFHVEQVPTDCQFLFSACGVNMLPPWSLPLRHSHSCLYTRSVFERKKMTSMPVHEDCLLRNFFEFLRPFVRSTPTTHSEGLLLRVGALPCAPTYNRGVVQHVVFNRLGLA